MQEGEFDMVIVRDTPETLTEEEVIFEFEVIELTWVVDMFLQEREDWREEFVFWIGSFDPIRKSFIARRQITISGSENKLALLEH